MTDYPYRVGLLGHGIVGGAFAKLLKEREDAIIEATGRTPILTGILTRSQGDFDEILDGSDAIIELMGGIEPAREYIMQALRRGLPVITANKQLLAQHGPELHELAHQHKTQLRYEASVAGVVPVIKVLSSSLRGAHINRISGIVNGTTNFILSEMEKGLEYGEALKVAQGLGFAEADPSDDVSGKDAAAKMVLLTKLAFGADLGLDDVYYDGIENLHSDDLEYARDFNLCLKLLGVAELRDGGVAVAVHPTLLSREHPLASVSGGINAVTIEGEAFEAVTISGPGAGGPPTASAVLGDLISVIRDEPAPRMAEVNLNPIGDEYSAFYVHVELVDRPGALASISGALGDVGISVQSVVQRGLGETARLILVVHPCSRQNLFGALAKVSELEILRSQPRVIHVLKSAE